MQIKKLPKLHNIYATLGSDSTNIGGKQINSTNLLFDPNLHSADQHCRSMNIQSNTALKLQEDKNSTNGTERERY